ncbi:4946_t:CDS:1 [Dentiscutata erythropus]|uniref:4946_t:CDS:1 n=1 Tax=Dentiscutata erythropus TaxID=1348616 RepID=A0A9N9B9K3_9GLOM|nr:4946_t:CDS:1 [Dentiscutata erythropus]
MANTQQYLIYVNELPNSSEISSLLSQPPYELTLSVEELTKAPIIKNRFDKIPRPSNAFMIYRRNYAAEMHLMHLAAQTTKTSTKVAKSWEKESELVKKFFKVLSLIAERNHSLMYPSYKFQPKSKKKKVLKFREVSFKKNKSKKSHNLTSTTTNLSSPEFPSNQVSTNNTSPVPQSHQLSNYGPTEIDDPFFSLFNSSSSEFPVPQSSNYGLTEIDDPFFSLFNINSFVA